MTTENAHSEAAERFLRSVAADLKLQAPEEVACDLSGDVLTMRFADGTKCTLIRQNPTQQIWLAEGVLAWYFDWKPSTAVWLDGRGKGPLATILTEVLERRLGRPVRLAADPEGSH